MDKTTDNVKFLEGLGLDVTDVADGADEQDFDKHAPTSVLTLSLDLKGEDKGIVDEVIANNPEAVLYDSFSSPNFPDEGKQIVKLTIFKNRVLN